MRKILIPLVVLVAVLAGTVVSATAAPRLYDVKRVLNAKSIPECYDPAMVEALERQGSVIVRQTPTPVPPPEDGSAPSEYPPTPAWRHFFDVYERLRYDDEPAFITTDSVLHYAHEVIGFTIEQVEEKTLYAAVHDMLKALAAATRRQMASATDARLKEAARTNLAIVSVAGALLDPRWIPDAAVRGPVSTEVARIRSAEAVTNSPLLGYDEDYTQYKPRGHYTRSERLTRYFRAMMWMGRAELSPKKPDRLLQAALMTIALQTSPALPLWNRMNNVVVRFVGPSANPSPLDYAALLKKVYGRIPAASDLPGKLDRLGEAAVALSADRPRQVNPLVKQAPGDEPGFRLAGQRFVPDSYAMSQLCFPHVGTSDNPRTMVSGLDVMAVLGSYTAESLQLESQKFERYAEQVQGLRKQFAALPAGTWKSSVYWTWLDALRPLLRPKQGPAFMKTAAWNRKSLNTALGSWTELRHDTILYAQPNYAEGGDIRSFAPMMTAKGFVEPEPLVLQRALDMCARTRAMLAAEHLMMPNLDKILATYEQSTQRLLSIARKEVAGTPRTLGDYEAIRQYGNVMEKLHKQIRVGGHVSARGSQIEDSTMALVADVHTDLRNQVVLEEGVGFPDEILVVVPVDGHDVIARGAVFSHYEFTRPMSERLDDKEWEQMLLAGKAPATHTWLASVLQPRNEAVQQAAVHATHSGDEALLEARAATLAPEDTRQVSWTPSSSPRYPCFENREGRIPEMPGRDFLVFVAGGQVRFGRSDGTGMMTLTGEREACLDPCWLPYECKLVFRRSSGDLTMYDYEVDDGYRTEYPYRYRRVTLVRNGAEPCGFSLPGFEERLLFTSTAGGRSQISLLDPGTTDARGWKRRSTGAISTRVLRGQPPDSREPSISPDARRIAFTARRGGRDEVWVMNLDGSKARALTQGRSPAWSPDGRLIAFVSDRAGVPNIWVMNADGTQVTRLTDTREGDDAPAWSPTRRELAFTSRRGGGVPHVWVMTLKAK